MISLWPNSSKYSYPFVQEALLQLSSMSCFDEVNDDSLLAINASNYNACYIYGGEFQEIIYWNRQNPFLAVRTINFYIHLAPNQRSLLHLNNRLQYSFDKQNCILPVPQNQKANTAESLLRGHLSTQGDSLRDFLSTPLPGILNMLNNHVLTYT